MQPNDKFRTSYLKFFLIFFLLVLLIGFAIWWFQQDEAVPPQTTEHAFNSGTISWTIAEYPAKVLHENQFTVDIKDIQGFPVHDANITVKLDMLSMVCGDYVFEMTEEASGKYTGDGVPLMAGIWKATLTLETKEQTYEISRLLKASH
ncbi:FixH family protein [Paenibacillus sp. 2TAB23]|uniref:FixH family protein n=1 Tax=Paenibacillus sp. 2TAB23 TaxID=3233004 RepID=UPI003F9C1821